jgi:predicted nucleotide-binding protein (sugar kinase/HSP70/actin superfamily)
MKAVRRASASLPHPYQSAFTRADRRKRLILIPNLSRSFTLLSVGVFRRLGLRSAALPFADNTALHLGKRFVHNDICFPAQVNVGEFLHFLNTCSMPASETAVAIAKNCRDCRAGHYFALTRKALDDAGHKDAAIITTGKDVKGAHPGFNAGVRFSLLMLYGIAVADVLDAMVLRTRPYEKQVGSVDRLYEEQIEKISRAMERSIRKCLKALSSAVDAFNAVPLKSVQRKPRVFVIGEILMNYHDTANRQIVRYLEKHGMEVLLPDMVNFFWRNVVVDRDLAHRRLAKRPWLTRLGAEGYDLAYRRALGQTDRIYSKFRFYEHRPDIVELSGHIEGFVDKTLIAGEGWLIPAEIMHHAGKGVTSFVIIQPFGCLPNQITGRGIVKPLKERFPHINILALDYDYDVSMANLENRLQMLVMASKGYSL